MTEGQEKHVAREVTILKTLSEVKQNQNIVKLRAVKVLSSDNRGEFLE